MSTSDSDQDPSIKHAPVAGRVAVVGVCASGKSMLVNKLRALGYDARHVAQDHSYVPDMWQRLSRPQMLVYLDASLATVRRRRDPSFPAALFQEQKRRLRHARCHCQICVSTDELTEDQVLELVLAALECSGVEPSLHNAPFISDATSTTKLCEPKGRKKC